MKLIIRWAPVLDGVMLRVNGKNKFDDKIVRFTPEQMERMNKRIDGMFY